MNVNLRKILWGSVIFLLIIDGVFYSCLFFGDYIPKESISPYMAREKYYRLFAVTKYPRIEEVKAKKKSQIKEQSIDSRTGYAILQFDGYKMCFDKFALVYIEVDSPKYRFGKKKIGVGSSLIDIQNAYKGQWKLTCRDPNEIGYIDGIITYNEYQTNSDSAIWIFFEFDKVNKCKKIKFHIGWG